MTATAVSNVFHKVTVKSAAGIGVKPVLAADFSVSKKNHCRRKISSGHLLMFDMFVDLQGKLEKQHILGVIQIKSGQFGNLLKSIKHGRTVNMKLLRSRT